MGVLLPGPSRHQRGDGEHVRKHPEALAQSTDFLHRKVDLLHHDLLVYAQYVTSYVKTNSMQSIKLTGESKK